LWIAVDLIDHAKETQQERDHEEIISSLVRGKFFRKFLKPSARTEPVSILYVAFPSCEIEKEIPHIHGADLMREHKPKVVAEGRFLSLTQTEYLTITLLMIGLGAVYPREYGHRVRAVAVVDLAIGYLIPGFTLCINGNTIGVTFHLSGKILAVQ